MTEPAATEDVSPERDDRARSAASTREDHAGPAHARRRRLLIGFAIYVACLVVFAIFAGDRLTNHTPYNHFAHLADAWLHGRQDLRFGPPTYAGNNDFAVFEGKTFISFPPFPAVLMLPFVALAGSPENFRDGQLVVWLAGIGPAVIFLVLEKLRRTGRSPRSERENVVLSILFAFGTVYFYSAVQGTVWFAAHVVGVGLTALFVLASLDAKHPIVAGALLGCMFLTRTTTLLVGVFFAFELVRVCYIRNRIGDASGELDDPDDRALPAEGSLVARVRATFAALDRRELWLSAALFAAPLLVALAFAARLNWQRFHDPRPWAFGHEYLTVGWQTRIRRWGLFSYHFLPRNLGVMFASLPWRPPSGETFGVVRGPIGAILKAVLGRDGAPFMISGHGVAVWFTTPLYFWLLGAKKRGFLFWAALSSALGPLVMNLLYQNSGWFQFGYRFSNDYAVLLFMMLAVTVRRFGRAFWIAATWSIAWNAFGAATFEREAYGAFYSHDPSAVFPID